MKALVRQTAIYTAANIVSRGAAVVALLIFPFILTPADYGAFGLVMMIAALVQLTVPLEVTQGMARYYGTADEAEKPGYGATAWWFSVLMLGAAGLVALALAGPLAAAIFGDALYAGTFRWSVPLVVCFTLSYTLQGLCRWKFMTGAYVVLSLSYAGLTLALGTLLALALPDALEGLVIGQATGMAITVAAAFVLLRRDLVRGIDGAKLRRMLRFSLPLVPASLFGFACLYGSRLMLGLFADLTDVGVFVLASQIAAIAGLAIIGVQSSMTPYVMAHYREPEAPATLARFFEGFAMLATLLCLAMGLLAPPVLAGFGPPAYAGAGPLVIILAPPAVMLGLYIFWPGFAISERTDLQLWVSLAAGTTGLAVNAALIPWLGIAGAAIASVVSAAIFLGMWIALSGPLYPIPVRWRGIAFMMMVYAATGTAATVIPISGFLSVVIRVALLIAAAFVILLLCRFEAGPVAAAILRWRTLRGEPRPASED